MNMTLNDVVWLVNMAAVDLDVVSDDVVDVVAVVIVDWSLLPMPTDVDDDDESDVVFVVCPSL